MRLFANGWNNSSPNTVTSDHTIKYPYLLQIQRPPSQRGAQNNCVNCDLGSPLNSPSREEQLVQAPVCADRPQSLCIPDVPLWGSTTPVPISPSFDYNAPNVSSHLLQMFRYSLNKWYVYQNSVVFSSIKVMVSYRWLVVFICESLLQSFISNFFLQYLIYQLYFGIHFTSLSITDNKFECIVLRICSFLSTFYVFFKEVHDLTLFWIHTSVLNVKDTSNLHQHVNHPEQYHLL